MANEAEIAERVEELLDAPVKTLGCRLLEVQYRFEGSWVLRLLIDKEGGTGIQDCSAVSELAGRVLEVEDPVPNAFSLEVSTPGLFRKLSHPRHFHQSIGKMVRLNVAPGVMEDEKSGVLRCAITEVQGETLLVEREGKILRIPMDGIRSARLDPEL